MVKANLLLKNGSKDVSVCIIDKQRSLHVFVKSVFEKYCYHLFMKLNVKTLSGQNITLHNEKQTLNNQQYFRQQITTQKIVKLFI